MKIICDCGNETEFSTIDEETGKETFITEDKGQYATINISKFNIWGAHYEVGFVCCKCNKSIWIFK